MPPRTVGDFVLEAAAWLGRKGVDAPRLDAELLLAHVLGCDRVRLYMDWHKPLIELEVSAFRELLRERGVRRVPVARLFGSKEFYGRRFEVTPAVFVPRPETEGLVERALALLDSDPVLRVDRPEVFDVGTGSGCIAVTLAAERPALHVRASDTSVAALEVARRNAAAAHVQARVEFRHGALFAGYAGSLHMIVTNPPYVAAGGFGALDPETREHDPRDALDGGADGLDVMRGILDELGPRLCPGGWLLAELGEEHEAPALALLHDSHLFDQARMERDLAGHPRYLIGRRRTV